MAYLNDSEKLKFVEVGRRLAEEGQALVGSGHGWQSALARRLGVATTTISTYLRGRSRPIGTMRERMEGLGMDVNYILTGRRRNEAPINPYSKAMELAQQLRADANRYGISDLDVIDEDIRLRIENARTIQERQLILPFKLIRNIIQSIREESVDRP